MTNYVLLCFHLAAWCSSTLSYTRQSRKLFHFSSFNWPKPQQLSLFMWIKFLPQNLYQNIGTFIVVVPLSLFFNLLGFLPHTFAFSFYWICHRNLSGYWFCRVCLFSIARSLIIASRLFSLFLPPPPFFPQSLPLSLRKATVLKNSQSGILWTGILPVIKWIVIIEGKNVEREIKLTLGWYLFTNGTLEGEQHKKIMPFKHINWLGLY